MVEIILPWWPKELRRNGNKHHWAAVSKAAKNCRELGWGAAMAAAKPNLASVGDIDLEVIFHPKTKHRIDRDNCVASCKNFFDGIADAWGVDDSRFAITPRIGEPIKGGCVVVRVK